MDLCVVDWRAIAPIFAALIASGTALYISNKWNKQKGAEVVANEAKQTIQDILEIINISYQMNSIVASPDFNAEKFKQFELLNEQILRSSLFINECIVIDDFKLLLDEFHQQCLSVKDIGFEFDPLKNNKKFKDELVDKARNVGRSGSIMADMLIPYSTYQKEFIFKKRS